jgi:4-amino-4-deoxy-L-arabinose transferase-like glycosyltransferase
MLLAAVWVFTVSHHHTALHHDMAEQFVWAHAWQLGYPKHPPLPTWLFMSVLTVLPPVPSTLYGLSALCIGLTGVFTYLAARELLPERAAIGVALLWSLMQPFSWRAWIYNHNTVLVMTVALTCFLSARAARRNSMGAWALAGVGAGLAMSTKLQAAVPLLGLLWALWRSGALATPFARRGLVCALVVAVLVSAAPLLWMATGHTNALAYATHQLGSGEGEGETMRVGQFVASELRMLSATLGVLLLWIMWSKQRDDTSSSPARPVASGAGRRAWVQGLLFIPLLFVLAMGLLGGAKLHAQWGVQTFQFAPLALVIWFDAAYERLSVRQLLAVAAVVHVAALILAVTPAGRKLHAPGAVEGYPSRELADKVLADWQRLAPNCPLRYVAAPFFEGGQMAAYAGSFPWVLEDDDPSKSPWVDVADMGKQGSVVFKRTVAELPPGAIHTDAMYLAPPPRVKGVWPIVWAIRPPQAGCRPSPANPGKGNK